MRVQRTRRLASLALLAADALLVRRLTVRPAAEGTSLVGNWIMCDGKVMGDEACVRIGVLTRETFRELGRADDGWSILYLDPEDGRLWELTYPLSVMHGGGPPRLDVISREAAMAKYGHLDA